MSIQTMDQIKQEQCWNQIKAVLDGHGYKLEPSVTIGMQGMSFAINLLPATAGVQGNTRGPSLVDGKAGG